MISFKTYLEEKAKEQEYEFWVAKSDANKAKQALKKLGLDYEKSKQKISGMEVFTVTGAEFELEMLQIELSQRDINSWLEGEKNS
jgi:adenylate cyclase class IV